MSDGVDSERIAQAGEVRSVRVESLRALAALSVVAGHAYAAVNGYGTSDALDKLMLGGLLGVFLFFALTGYLLFWPFARRAFGDGTPLSLHKYARNRAARILPLYYVVVATLLVVKEDGGTWEQWWRFATFSQNFSESTAGTVNGPMWTLVVEVQFYALLPLVAALLAAAGRGRRGAAACLGAAGVASVVLQEVVHPPLHIWSLSLATTFVFFVAGMLLALLRLEWEERRPACLDGPLGRSDLWLLAGAVPWIAVVARYEQWWLVALGAFCLVGACVLPLRRGVLSRALSWRPLAAVGVASYSLYLWHFPILEWLAERRLEEHGNALFAAGVALLIPGALASYAAVEAPFLRLRRRWSRAAAPQLGSGRAGVRS